MFLGKPKRKTTALYKHEVLDITHQICPPCGTGIENTIKSTWMKPIVDGKDGTLIKGELIISIPGIGKAQIRGEQCLIYIILCK